MESAGPAVGEKNEVNAAPAPPNAPVIDFQSLGRPQNAREQFLIEVIDRYRALLAERTEAFRQIHTRLGEARIELLHAESLIAVVKQEHSEMVEKITFSGFPPEVKENKSLD